MSSELHTNFFLGNLDGTLLQASLAEVSSPSLKDLMKSESLLVELTPYSADACLRRCAVSRAGQRGR